MSGEQGLPVGKRLLCRIKKKHSHRRYVIIFYFTFSQGAPGPKGEPGEGLNEVRDATLFSFWAALKDNLK